MEPNTQNLRACENCKNLFQLNLFRPDGIICRFCEMGIKVPTYMIRKQKEEIVDDLKLTSEPTNELPEAGEEINY